MWRVRGCSAGWEADEDVAEAAVRSSAPDVTGADAASPKPCRESPVSPEWRAAQDADGGFISDYARDHPDREDVAESILPYFAVRFRPGRLSAEDRAAIEATIPNRLAYFDQQGFDWAPYMQVVPAMPAAAVVVLATLLVAARRLSMR